MAKKTLLTTEDGTYHKVKKGYLTVDGFYRRVKKAYVTIGGVYRPCWSGGELSYYGITYPLTYPTTEGSAASIENYALFSTVYYDSDDYVHYTVDVYDSNLTKHAPKDINNPIYLGSATSISNYALLSTGTSDRDVAAFNASLTQSYVYLSTQRLHHGAATVGDYALFAGGTNGNGVVQESADVFNTSLTSSQIIYLRVHSQPRGASIGNYAIFKPNDSSSHMSALDSSLTKVAVPLASFSVSDGIAATSNGAYALFGGGLNYPTSHKTVDAYDSSLVRTNAPELIGHRRDHVGTSVEGFAVFFGGGFGEANECVDAYDQSLTHTTVGYPSEYSTGSQAAGTTVGNYALFGGGYNNQSGSKQDTMLVFTVA